jgi:hypothetical protein
MAFAPRRWSRQNMNAEIEMLLDQLGRKIQTDKLWCLNQEIQRMIKAHCNSSKLYER